MLTTPPTRVVNIRFARYSVYVGRSGHNLPGPWGNPFVVGCHGNLAQVLLKYARWIARQPRLLARLPELRGQRLGCFCLSAAGGSGAPLREGRPEAVFCHGQILCALADGMTPAEVIAVLERR